MVDREFLSFEIGFYESKIAHFRELIARYETNISEVRGELCTLTAARNPPGDTELTERTARE